MAIEAALVIPLLATLVFGMIEMSFAVRDYASVSSLARQGARIASTGADAGPASSEVCDSTGAEDLPPCAPERSPALAQLAADAVQNAGSAMPSNQVNYILVYKSNPEGMPGTLARDDPMPASCAAVADLNCVQFRWNERLGVFRYAGGSWDSSTISACFPGERSDLPLDSVGVYVNARHEMLTGLFGAGITMSDRAVMRFEPLEYDSCGAGQHD